MRHSRSPPAQALPAGALDKIRQVPGNEKCLDCGAVEPDWGDVQHGSLHCIQCAGSHRSLGVRVSVVRSLTMDNWTEANLLAMLLGGNKQLRSFFERRTRVDPPGFDTAFKPVQRRKTRRNLSSSGRRGCNVDIPWK